MLAGIFLEIFAYVLFAVNPAITTLYPEGQLSTPKIFVVIFAVFPVEERTIFSFISPSSHDDSNSAEKQAMIKECAFILCKLECVLKQYCRTMNGHS